MGVSMFGLDSESINPSASVRAVGNAGGGNVDTGAGVGMGSGMGQSVESGVGMDMYASDARYSNRSSRGLVASLSSVGSFNDSMGQSGMGMGMGISLGFLQREGTEERDAITNSRYQQQQQQSQMPTTPEALNRVRSSHSPQRETTESQVGLMTPTRSSRRISAGGRVLATDTPAKPSKSISRTSDTKRGGK